MVSLAFPRLVLPTFSIHCRISALFDVLHLVNQLRPFLANSAICFNKSLLSSLPPCQITKAHPLTLVSLILSLDFPKQIPTELTQFSNLELTTPLVLCIKICGHTKDVYRRDWLIRVARIKLLY